MTHPILPKLISNRKISNFNEAGKWVARDASELAKLSDDLDIEKIEFPVNSIPDMWARPLLFDMALMNVNHALHERVRGEWRGMLALLALQEVRGFRHLDACEVRISGESSEPDFIRALHRLAPRGTLADDTSWLHLFVFTYRQAAIGMTSPFTLVATATNYHAKLDMNLVPWFEGQYLQDPVPYLGSQDKAALASWLVQLRNNLNEHLALRRESRWNKLLTQLNDFIHEVGEAETITYGSARFKLPGIFAHLERPVRAAAFDPPQSAVRLQPTRIPAPETEILVVAPDIAQQWRIPAYEIRVLPKRTLDAAIDEYTNDPNDTRRIAGEPLAGAVKWTPKNFFTERLFVIRRPNAFPAARQVSGANFEIRGEHVTPILPINPKLLEYLTSEDFYREFRFEPLSDRIVVTLRVKLGPQGKGRDFDVRHEYRYADGQVLLLDDVPVLEVWPNFVTEPAWQAYYTFYSLQGVAEAFYAEPYAHNVTPVKEQVLNARGGIEREVTYLTRFPEAFVCRARVANHETGRSEELVAGVLLMAPPRPLSLRNQEFKIGIDFGATNTNIYGRKGEGEPFAIHFQDRLIQVTDAAQDRRNRLYDFFLPNATEATPFQSLFRDFGRRVNGNDMRPLLDGHIYYLRDHTSFNAGEPGVETDLKWSDRSEDLARTEAFLKQLCLQAAAEAVEEGAARISWAYSYPAAYQRKLRNNIQKIWKAILENTVKRTGVAVEGDAEERTESLASALFFRTEAKAPTQDGAICIDIGGSTSDIAIWQGDQLRWQTSVRLAGRELLLDALRRQPKILSRLGADTSPLERLRDNREKYAQLDAILIKEGPELLKRLRHHSAEEPIPRLIQYGALGLAGLLYYVGLVLRHLVEQGQFEKRLPSIHVGGNASKLFHWLDSGNYDPRSPINDLFKKVFLQASALDAHHQDFVIQISSKPKAEAAYGLVCDSFLQAVEVEDRKVLAGEIFLRMRNKQKADWNELIGVDELQGGIGAPTSLDRLKDFLQAFNEYARAPQAMIPPVEIDISRDVRKRVANRLSELAQQAADDIQVEPIFIIALKKLLEVFAEDQFQRTLQAP